MKKIFFGLFRSKKPGPIKITEEDLDRFRKWIETASREEIEEQMVSDEQRAEILAEVRRLNYIPREELERKCRRAA